MPWETGPDIYYCPNHDFAAYQRAAGGADAWHWPSYAPNIMLLPMFYGDVGSNKELVAVAPHSMLEAKGTYGTKYLSLGELARPSEQVLYGESDMTSANNWWLVINKYWLVPGVSSGGRGAKHWDDQSSSVFADGHAQPLYTPVDNAERDRHYGL